MKKIILAATTAIAISAFIACSADSLAGVESNDTSTLSGVVSNSKSNAIKTKVSSSSKAKSSSSSAKSSSSSSLEDIEDFCKNYSETDFDDVTYYYCDDNETYYCDSDDGLTEDCDSDNIKLFSQMIEETEEDD